MYLHELDFQYTGEQKQGLDLFCDTCIRIYKCRIDAERIHNMNFYK
jgi:hypothetical protein